MQYPLTVNFKIMAFAAQISVTNGEGQEVLYVKQKMLKLKEKVNLFTDSSKTQPLCDISANKILDFNAAYNFTRPDGQAFGSVRRKGMRSFWKAHYDVFSNDNPAYTITEGNPMVKVLDSIIGEIPVLGFFTGFMFHPRYDVTDTAGNVCYTLTKKPAFFGGKFVIEETAQRDDDVLVLVALMMMVLLERRRG